jgi:cobalt-zinc-cadmium efflux system outer membrane protein
MFNAVILVIAGLTVGADEVATTGDTALAEYLVEASANHPGLKAKHAAWLAALERVPQVTSLDDPKLTYGHFVRSNNFTHRVALSQHFPWFGTLKGRGNVAETAAETALSRLEGERLEMYAAVKEAYFAYDHLGEQLGVTESQVALLEYMEEVVLSKYSLGLAGQNDLLRIQIEGERVRDRQRHFQLLRPSFSANLCEALGRSTDTNLPWPGEHGLPTAPPSEVEMLRLIRARNPAYLEMGHHVAGRHEETALAKLGAYPNFTAGLDYTSVRNPRTFRGFDEAGSATFGHGNGEDNVMLSLSVNVPLFRKRVKARIAEAEYRAHSAVHAQARTGQSLESAAHAALFSVQHAEHRYHLFQGSLLPKEQQAYENLQSAYASGDAQARFLDVLDSIQTLLEFELQLLDSTRNWHQATARLEALVGGPWESVEGSEAHH